MKARLLRRWAALRLVVVTCTASACATQPITIGDEALPDAEQVGEQAQPLATTASYWLSDSGSATQVKSVEGGAVKAPVISITAGATGGVVRKHLGAVQYDAVTVPLPSSAPGYIDWAQAALENNFVSKDLSLVHCDANGKAVYSRSFHDSTLSALTFGPFDASASASVPPLFKATFTPAQTTAAPGDGSRCLAPLPPKARYMGNFELTLDGVDAKGVVKIDEFRLTRSTTPPSGALGGVRQSESLSVPNLRISIAESFVEPWQAWFDSFVIDGNNGAEHELNGEIALLTPDLKTALLRVRLGGVGISRLAAPGSDPESTIPGRWTAELYVEKIDLQRR